jgi:hypothetical protein
LDELIIKISPTGETTIEVQGVKGESCKAVTEGIERALGKVTKDVETDEMREAPVNVHNQNYV